ncbi:hypothetical protein L7F22_000183 [Adiantum nelumboides]|nr:hypothetical protein [Adiantum nelumboides]
MAGGQQLEVLSALDKAKTQWYHFTAIIIAGMGFFTDAYDLFCISTVSRLLGRIYYYNPATGKLGTLPPNVSTAVNGVALCGTLTDSGLVLASEVTTPFLQPLCLSMLTSALVAPSSLLSFAMQGTGILAGATVSIIVSAAFNNIYRRPAFEDDHIGSTPPQADFVWRLVFMLGATFDLLLAHEDA